MTNPFTEAIRRAITEGHYAPDAPPLKAIKHQAYIEMPLEQAMDEGLIPDTRPPVRISRWRRLRWTIAERWANLRLRLGSRIAGIDLNERQDW